MATAQQAAKPSTVFRVESREFEYPADCKSKTSKDKHKDKTLRENPEVLFVDFVHREDKKKNNLIFFTESTYIWKDVMCSHYAYVVCQGIGSGGRLRICKDEQLDTDDCLLTISYYTNGKIMVQSTEAHLVSFEEAFPLFKVPRG